MLALVNKKSIIVGLILFMVLLAGPVSAKRALGKANKSSQNRSPKRQNKSSVGASKVTSAFKGQRSNNRVSLGSTRGQRQSRSATVRKQSSPGRIQQRSFRQSHTISARPKTSSKVISRPITSSPKRPTALPSISRRFPAIRRKTATIPKAPKKVADNTRRISKSKMIVIGRPGKSVQPKPKEQSTKRPTRTPPERNRQVSAIPPKAEKKDRIVPSASNNPRKSSIFTWPTFRKRRATEATSEKSQHTPREGKKHDGFRPTDGQRRTYRYDNRRDLFGSRRRSRVFFHERDNVARHRRHYEHIYRDWRNRIHHRIIWPKYRFHLYYNWGRRFTFRYCYPYYHRKYIFVSLNGYWPLGYDYMRYYWYGCHPYDWYGYYPVPREVQGDTYNYYTYNYYGDSDEAIVSTQSTDGIQPVDHETFADVREKLAQQAAEEPAPETEADRLFDEAVKDFEKGDYEKASEKFAQAAALSPADIVLPFAYAQALFANEKYSETAEILRTALEKLSPEEEGVFYPRGLYPDEEILLDQIDKLSEKADLYSYDSDLQLLLGYQLLGIGELDAAAEPLHNANREWLNRTSVEILLGLLEKIKAQEAEDQSRQ